MYETEIESIDGISVADLNNLRNLYQTPIGSIPLERDKGIDISYISMPPEVAKNMFMVEVIKKTRLYTEFEVVEIAFYIKEKKDGNLTAKVVVQHGE